MQIAIGLVLNEVAANLHVLTDWKRQSRQRALSCSITVCGCRKQTSSSSIIPFTDEAELESHLPHCYSIPPNYQLPKENPNSPTTRCPGNPSLNRKKCALAGLCDVKRDIFLSNNNTQQCSSKWRRLPPSRESPPIARPCLGFHFIMTLETPPHR